MKLNIVKRTVLATALAVATAVTGVAGQAQAFTFGEGDLVLAIYGNNTEALLNLGHALKAQGKPDEARSCWKQALDVKPELAQGYFEQAAG